jgi:glycosyltransferase involved in cell wall biosynthesis
MPRVTAYVLVTPVRNEARFIELTLESVVRQTALPLKWVIVDDGSTDGTDEIVRRYVDRYRWIELVTLTGRHEHNFAGKVGAFNEGYARVKDLDFEVVGNLDGDVSFDAEYLEFLLDKFAEDPALGVAGTPYRETPPIRYERFKSPRHVSGACQLFRRRCFEEIGGYSPVPSGGVDFIAVLSAQTKGWTTTRFEQRACVHHRAVGAGRHQQVLRRMFGLGRKDYLLGSHPAFEMFRCLYRTIHPPYVVGGALMAAGYLSAWARRMHMSMEPELVRFRQQEQLRRLKYVLCHPLRQWRGPVALAAPSVETVASSTNEPPPE